MLKCCVEGSVTGLGSYKSGVAIVGIAPGANEWKQKQPFIGQSGKVLDALLSSIGLSRGDIFITNVHCQFNNSPSQYEIDKCKARLDLELEHARIIVPMGAIATSRFTNIPFNKVRGAVLYEAVPSKIVIPCYHPSGVLQASDKPDLQNQMASDLSADFETIRFVLDGKTREYITYVKYELVLNSLRGQELLDSFDRDELITLDLETDYEKELDQRIFDQKIQCIGVGYKDKIYVYAGDGLNVEWPIDLKYVTQNGWTFDMIGMWIKYGYQLPITEDTYAASYSLDERNRPGLHKLKNRARQYAGGNFYEEEEHKDLGEALYGYNALDISHTKYLINFFRPLQEEQDVRRVYEELLIPGANLLAEAQYYGLPIDFNALAEESIKLLKLLKDSEASLQEMAREAGVKDLNLNSSQQISHLLYDVYKLPVVKRTKAGAPSSDKESLQDVVHPFVDELLHRRMYDRLFTGYAAKAFMLLKQDGRLHPSGSVAATTSGRLAYRDPPIQTLPKSHTVGEFESIRRIFITESDEYVLVAADYKQIELYVAQCLSRDEQMGEDLLGDMHSAGAEAFYKAKNPGHDKDCTCSQECIDWNYYRYSAKHINFGSLFEMSPTGYTRKPPLGIGCSLQEATKLHSAWQNRYFETVAWKDEIRQEIKTKGYITTLFGRRRRMNMVLNQRQLRQIVNAPIQGTASDCTLSACIELRPLLKQLDSRILFLVHDEGVFHVAKKHLQEALELIKTIMEKPRHSLLPGIKVEMTVGSNLYEMRRV